MEPASNATRFGRNESLRSNEERCHGCTGRKRGEAAGSEPGWGVRQRGCGRALCSQGHSHQEVTREVGGVREALWGPASHPAPWVGPWDLRCA